MGLEIDVLSIGQGDAGCGDAIAIRLWNSQTAWVIVIDGGYAGDGEAVVEHVRNSRQPAQCIAGDPERAPWT
jgi:hypothetical protein